MGLLDGLIMGAVGSAIRSSRESDMQDIKDYESTAGQHSLEWEGICGLISQAVKDRCKELSNSATRLESYLNNCVNERLVKRKYIPAIMYEFLSAEQYTNWVEIVAGNGSLVDQTDKYLEEKIQREKDLLKYGLLIGSVVSASRNESQEDDYTADEYNLKWEEVQSCIPQAVKDRCKEYGDNATRLEKYLNACADGRLINSKYIPAIMREHLSAQAFSAWCGIPDVSIVNNLNELKEKVPDKILTCCASIADSPEFMEKYLKQCQVQGKIDEETRIKILSFVPQKKELNSPTQNQSVQNPQKVVILATSLKGIAPDSILQYCDSIAHKKVLLETYLMQCQNQGKLNKKTADTLMKAYAQHMGW